VYCLSFVCGADVTVKTQLPGHELSLKVGDRVEVYGGPDDGGRFFLSSGVYKKCPDGSIVRLRVNTMDAPDQVVQGAVLKRPW
jgi:hypothetical protein